MGYVTALEFLGGTTTRTISSNLTLDYRYRVWLIKTTTSSLLVKWPATTLPVFQLGGPVFIVINNGTSGGGNVSFSVQDTEELDTAVSVAIGKATVVCTYLRDGAKRWAPHLSTGMNFNSY